MGVTCMAAWMAMLGGAIAAPVRSGRAEVEWAAESETVKAGAVWRTVLRVTVDPGWHIYWINPGESGSPTTVSWSVPDGWPVPDISHPLPVRFQTGGLAGFGHEGTARFPVSVRVPDHFTGESTLRARVSWLSCNNDACVPGEADVMLPVRSGVSVPGPHAMEIAQAFETVPESMTGKGTLQMLRIDRQLALSIRGEISCDPGQSQVFPMTPDVVDPSARIDFRRVDGGWDARVAASPYLPSLPPRLELLLVPPGPGRPVVMGTEK